MEYNINIKGDHIKISDTQFEIIKKYAQLIEDETSLNVQITNFYVVCEEGKYKS